MVLHFKDGFFGKKSKIIAAGKRFIKKFSIEQRLECFI
jgi:hypothetical protein